MSGKTAVDPDCRNSSNPYHQCSEFCFKFIAEAKKLPAKSEPEAKKPAAKSEPAPKLEDIAPIQPHNAGKGGQSPLLPFFEESKESERSLVSASIARFDSRFDLSDIENMVGKEKVPRVTPLPKGNIPRARSVSKKRKDTTNVVELEPPVFDLKKSLSSLQSSTQQIVDQVMKYCEDLEGRVEEAERTVQELRKIDTLKNKLMEKERLELLQAKEKLEGIEAEHQMLYQDIINETKKSAAVSVTQARILMAEEAERDGYSNPSWDLLLWRATLTKLSGKLQESGNLEKKECSSKAREQGVTKDTEQEVTKAGEKDAKD